MVFHSQIFWGCLGGIFCWIFVWAGLSNVIKQRQPYRNRFMNKFAENIEIVVILPFLPPILVYALFLRFFYDPPRRLIRRGRQRRRTKKAVLAEREVAGALRRDFAQEDLQHVRREKMPLVEEWDVVEGKLPVQDVLQDGFFFAHVPAELRIEIYHLLDYGTALRLSQVNKFFYYERPYNSIDKEQRMTFLWYSEAFPQNMRRRLACYGCLRTRSRGDFLEENRTGDFDRFGDRELERRCFDCVAKTDSNISRLKLWRFKFWRWKMQASHGSRDRSASV